jgi:hypothetical protein
MQQNRRNTPDNIDAILERLAQRAGTNAVDGGVMKTFGDLPSPRNRRRQQSQKVAIPDDPFSLQDTFAIPRHTKTPRERRRHRSQRAAAFPDDHSSLQDTFAAPLHVGTAREQRRHRSQRAAAFPDDHSSLQDTFAAPLHTTTFRKGRRRRPRKGATCPDDSFSLQDTLVMPGQRRTPREREQQPQRPDVEPPLPVHEIIAPAYLTKTSHETHDGDTDQREFGVLSPTREQGEASLETGVVRVVESPDQLGPPQHQITPPPPDPLSHLYRGLGGNHTQRPRHHPKLGVHEIISERKAAARSRREKRHKKQQLPQQLPSTHAKHVKKSRTPSSTSSSTSSIESGDELDLVATPALDQSVVKSDNHLKAYLAYTDSLNNELCKKFSVLGDMLRLSPTVGGKPRIDHLVIDFLGNKDPVDASLTRFIATYKSSHDKKEDATEDWTSFRREVERVVNRMTENKLNWDTDLGHPDVQKLLGKVDDMSLVKIKQVKDTLGTPLFVLTTLVNVRAMNRALLTPYDDRHSVLETVLAYVLACVDPDYYCKLYQSIVTKSDHSRLPLATSGVWRATCETMRKMSDDPDEHQQVGSLIKWMRTLVDGGLLTLSGRRVSRSVSSRAFSAFKTHVPQLEQHEKERSTGSELRWSSFFASILG